MAHNAANQDWLESGYQEKLGEDEVWENGYPQKFGQDDGVMMENSDPNQQAGDGRGNAGDLAAIIHRSHSAAARRERRRIPGKPSDKAMLIRGVVGRYSFVNGKFEPYGMHGNFACWRCRVNGCHLFHTGRSRWVISKAMDDGLACYAYCTADDDDNPANCKGPWTRCTDQREWIKDSDFQCIAAAADELDHWSPLRSSTEDELHGVRIGSAADRHAMWKVIDRAGEGAVDAAVVEAFVDNLLFAGIWPPWLNCQTALDQAYKVTLKDSGGGDLKLYRCDFHALLLNIFWFSKLHGRFQLINTTSDDRLEFDEFVDCIDKLGLHVPHQTLWEEFNGIDKDSDGTVEYGDFCQYVRNRIQPETSDGRSAVDATLVELRQHVRERFGEAYLARPKSLSDFDAVERQIKVLCREASHKRLHKLWKSLDHCGDNVVSLDEVDKWVMEQYPVLNDQSALSRAHAQVKRQTTRRRLQSCDSTSSQEQRRRDEFRASDFLGESSHDEADYAFVEKKDFKRFLAHLFYHSKLSWLCPRAGSEAEERCMTLKDVQFCMNLCGMRLSRTKAKMQFEKLGANSEGKILFDDFCAYVTSRACPEALTAFTN